MRTYGDLSPGAPRFTGQVLRAYGDEVPWHRVVRADGSLAKGERQRALLDAEGVPLHGARVDLRVARLPAPCGPSVTSSCARARAASTSSPTRSLGALPELGDLRVGLLHLFIRHTSAGLTLNENASPDVRRDFEAWVNAAVPRTSPGRTRSRAPTTCPPTSRRR